MGQTRVAERQSLVEARDQWIRTGVLFDNSQEKYLGSGHVG
jgi:hypothetical protein